MFLATSCSEIDRAVPELESTVDFHTPTVDGLTPHTVPVFEIEVCSPVISFCPVDDALPPEPLMEMASLAPDETDTALDPPGVVSCIVYAPADPPVARISIPDTEPAGLLEIGPMSTSRPCSSWRNWVSVTPAARATVVCATFDATSAMTPSEVPKHWRLTLRFRSLTRLVVSRRRARSKLPRSVAIDLMILLDRARRP